ncbi:MAG: hypothetical protein WC194_11715, partial [Mesotoga sp.]
EAMYKTLHKDLEPESAEEAAARERREQRNSTLMALSDGLSGIANIWGAAKGATPADLSSLSEANRMRYEYAKRERERNTDAWRRGVFTSRMQDIQNRQANEQAHLKAEREKEERAYKRSRDKIADTYKDKELEFKQAEAERKAELETMKFEELQKKNEADLKIRQRTVALAEKKAAAALNNTSGTGIKKVVRFGLKDGTNITVPDDLKGSYVADVYNKLVDAAGDATIDSKGETTNPILSFMKFQFGQKEPGLSEMMTAIQLYASEYGVEDYMIERANQYTANYQTPVAKDQPAPGSPGSAKVPISSGVMAGALTNTAPPPSATAPVQQRQGYSQEDADEISALIGLPIPARILSAMPSKLDPETTRRITQEKFGDLMPR